MDQVPGERAAIVQWLSSGHTTGVLLRLLMAIAASWYSIVLGAFSYSPAEAVLVGLGLLGLFALVLAAWNDEPPRWSFPVAAVLCVIGAIVAASTNFTGWFLFGMGCVVVVGRPQAPYLLGALGWGAGAVTMVSLQVHNQPTVDTLLWNSVAVIGVLLLGITRRQSAIRRLQQAQLMEQTERTRTETARAAALEERNRIARELHDLLAHSLGGLVVQLDAAEAVLAAGGDQQQVAERLRSSRQLAVDGLRDARAAVRELRSDERPADGSVADAVAAVINGPVGMQLGLTLDIVGEPYLVPYEVGQTFAAVAREAITNINKHAPGGRATASLIFTGEQVRLELINALADRQPVQDDLVRSGGGFGLVGMRRRMDDIGGTLQAGVDGNRWVVTADWEPKGSA